MASYCFKHEENHRGFNLCNRCMYVWAIELKNERIKELEEIIRQQKIILYMEQYGK